MRFLFGQGWVHEAPADDTPAGGGGAAGGESAGGTNDAGGGADDAGDGSVVEEVPADGDDAAGGDKGAGAGKKDEAPAADPNAPKSMRDAIDQGLKYTKPKEPAVDDKQKVETHANGKPKKDAKGNELDDQGKVIKQAPAPKAKTSAELALKPEEIKAMSQPARQRFNELIGTLKSSEAQVTKLTADNTTLARARDSLFSAMDDAKMGKDDLAGYLEYHAMMTSGDPKQLKDALDILNVQRSEIMKALGIDGDGVDLLADFPDLKKKVEDEQMDRAAAVEVATARRREAGADKIRQGQQQQQQRDADAETRRKEAEKKGMADINTWCSGLSTTDIDYKAKEAMLLEPQGDQPAILDQVLKEYPPEKWVPTLKLLYAGLHVQRQRAPMGGDHTIRPSGARPGDKAPGSMLEAINQGLKYKSG